MSARSLIHPQLVAFRRFARRRAIQTGLNAATALARGGVLARARGRGVIFTLHHVRPEQTADAFRPNAHLSVTPDFLDAAIGRLKALGLEPVALADIPARLADPQRPPFFAFTLDDGYRNNRDHALPVFERHGVPFTVFVTGGFVDRTHSIWWETAEALLRQTDTFVFDFGRGTERLSTRRRIDKYAAFDRLHKAVACARQDDAVAAIDAAARAAGIDPIAIVDRLTMDEDALAELAGHPLASLGAHSISHANLASVGPERLERELCLSAERVAAIGGGRPAAFAYPYGDRCAAGPREFRAALAAGFSLAVTTRPGTVAAESAQRPTALGRISLNGYYQRPRYVEALASGLPFWRPSFLPGPAEPCEGPSGAAPAAAAACDGASRRR